MLFAAEFELPFELPEISFGMCVASVGVPVAAFAVFVIWLYFRAKTRK